MLISLSFHLLVTTEKPYPVLKYGNVNFPPPPFSPLSLSLTSESLHLDKIQAKLLLSESLRHWLTQIHLKTSHLLAVQTFTALQWPAEDSFIPRTPSNLIVIYALAALLLNPAVICNITFTTFNWLKQLGDLFMTLIRHLYHTIAIKTGTALWTLWVTNDV